MAQTQPRTPPRLSLPPELDPHPAPAPGSRRRRATRVLRWVAGVASVLLLVATTALYLGYRHFNGKLTRTDIRSTPGTAAQEPVATSAQNFVIVGSDTREAPGTQKFGAKKGSAKFVAGQRSDTVMLLHIPPGKAKATLVSFPRDSWVYIPAYTDANGVRHPGHHQRINSAFELGGAPLLVQVLERLSGLRVDHYVQVDFAGFQRIVDALGGVTLCARTTRHDADSGDYFAAGTRKVNGKQALAFARDRHSFPSQDLARIKDQQYLVSVLLHKVLSAGTLANPLKINALLNAVTSSTTVDRDLSINDMRRLALRMRHLDPAHVQLLTVPVQGDAVISGQDVLVLDRTQMGALFADLRNDKTPGEAGPVTVPIAPARVAVSVLNGTSRPGLAATAAAALRKEGFQARVGGNGTAPGASAAATVVQYGGTAAGQARTVAAALPGATLVRAATGSPSAVTVVLGTSYTGTRAVAVQGQSASGSATGRTTAEDSANGCGQ